MGAHLGLQYHHHCYVAPISYPEAEKLCKLACCPYSRKSDMTLCSETFTAGDRLYPLAPGTPFWLHHQQAVVAIR